MENEEIQNKYKYLKKQTEFNNAWDLDNIKDGLLYFNDVNGRYPTAREIDHFEFLPSSRQLQRNFGGVVSIRKKLNLPGPSDHSKGKSRSIKAREADVRAKIYEKEFYQFLTSKIPEVRVHEHKLIRPGDTSSDFFIYTSETEGIVIDLFYAQDLFTASKIVNIKHKKYSPVVFPVYFIVVGNDNILQEELNLMISNRKIPLSQHIQVFSEVYFKDNFEKLYEYKL